MSENSYLPPNPMWIKLTVDPDNLDPEYMPEIDKSENWPGRPVAVLTIGRDDEAQVSISTLSVTGDMSTYTLLLALLEVTEWHAVNSGQMPEDSFFPRALSGARLWLESQYEQYYNEGDE